MQRFLHNPDVQMLVGCMHPSRPIRITNLKPSVADVRETHLPLRVGAKIQLFFYIRKKITIILRIIRH